MADFQKIKNFISKKRFIILAVIVVVGGFLFNKSRQVPQYELFTVSREQSLTQEVASTGRVQAANSVDLAFETSGRVEKLNFKVGQKVTAGKTLATLSSADLSAQLSQSQSSVESAQAALQIQQAKLAEVKNGSRPEDITIAQTKLSNAQKSYEDAQQNATSVQNKADLDLDNLYTGIPSIAQDAYAKADDALNKQIDEIFSDDTTTNPQLTILVVSAQAKYNAESGRVIAQNAFVDLKREVDTLPIKREDQEAALLRIAGKLKVIRDFMTSVGEAVNVAVGLTSTTQNIYRANVGTARSQSVAALSAVEGRSQAIANQKVTNINAITAARTALNTAQSTVTLAQNELSLKQAGSLPEQVKAQEGYVAQAAAQVRLAQANVRSIQANIAKASIVSPVDGIVSAQDIKVGEIASAYKNVISIVTVAQFEIESNIPEVDIAQVHIGQTATVTLDAYGNNTLFDATITGIDPAETVVNNVTTYKVTFHFNKEDERIKPGMTANISILADKHDKALAIPVRAITKKGSQGVVRVLMPDNKVEERLVITGLQATNGLVEVVAGVEEGEKVILGDQK
ncbi:MAG: efflux RND transporter periplasmic adaptor subunit [Patescibacteria group bacterium]